MQNVSYRRICYAWSQLGVLFQKVLETLLGGRAWPEEWVTQVYFGRLYPSPNSSVILATITWSILPFTLPTVTDGTL